MLGRIVSQTFLNIRLTRAKEPVDSKRGSLVFISLSLGTFT